MKRKRDATARSRIKSYLAEQGTVRHDGGGATTVLREAIGYQGSPVAFIQLITAMDEAGELVREVRGKRTYAISVAQGQTDAFVPKVPDLSERTARPATPEIDYDELARSLLRELGRVLASVLPQEGANVVPAGTADQTRVLVAERDRLQAERDDYAARLETSRRQLNALAALYVGEEDSEGTDPGKPGSTQAPETDVSASERAS